MGNVGPGSLAHFVTGYAIQVWLAHVWMRCLAFGRAEWPWRFLTYWQAQLMKQTRPATAA